MKERPILFSGPMVRALLAGTKTQTRRLVKWRGETPDFHGGRGDTLDLSAWGWFFDGPRHNGYMVLERGLDERHDHGHISLPSPYGDPGVRLWVRETWSTDQLHVYPCPRAWYRADFGRYEDPALSAGEFHTCSKEQRARKVSVSDCWACVRDAYGKFIWKPSIHMPRRASRLSLEITGVRVERLQKISEADAKAEGIEQMAHVWKNYDRKDRLQFIDPRDSYRSLWESINGPGSWELNPWVWVIEFKKVDGARA